MISKEINFQKYFTESIEENNVSVGLYNKLIKRRTDRIRYKSCDETLVRFEKFLANPTDSYNQMEEINKLTPLFCYHQTECDYLVTRIVEQWPEIKDRLQQIQEHAIKNSKRTRPKPNYSLDLDNMKITYKYVTSAPTEKVELVLCALPALWTPDAALYYLEDL